MQESLVKMLRCPITKSKLSLKIITKKNKQLDGNPVEIIDEGILFAENACFYPVVKGIPRLTSEAVLDYNDFLQKNLIDFTERKAAFLHTFGEIIFAAQKKNKRTKKSFTKEWSLFNYDTDKTWDADQQEMLERFYVETDETAESLKNKIVFDAGCGNGLLNILLGKAGITNIGMDFSNSVERAYDLNESSKVHFIQGDVQFPPVQSEMFDVVHSSGVLIATNNTELSFSCIDPLLKKGGKMSVWLYHSRKNFSHNVFNKVRNVTSKLPLGFQYYLYSFTLFPVSYVIKRAKGNKQNSREMMTDILDWFTPQFRWEHTHTEAAAWFYKRSYKNIKITTDTLFGFNIAGVKSEAQD
jgi:ubiquinone/menaquinone biosynthesis C-methylase UbiE/uncharacterized protein YbaR (Trm112 family)